MFAVPDQGCNHTNRANPTPETGGNANPFRLPLPSMPHMLPTMQYWLMKSEPRTFSIDDLKAAPDGVESWDGIRNYQARNFMRDDMRQGDRVLFYHSSCPTPGVAGLAEVAREAHPDHTAWDPESDYFDPKASPENPRWFMVAIRFVEAFPHIVPLAELRRVSTLRNMKLLQRGQRLSIQPVTKKEYETICRIGRSAASR